MEEPKKKKTVFKIIIDALFYAFIALTCAVVGISIIQKTTNIKISKYNVVWVLTDSMYPTIEPHSYILTKTSDGSDAEVGDIVTYIVTDESSPIYGKTNTHRIIRIDDDGKIVTKGDNEVGEDTPFEREYIVAIYSKNLPVFTFFGRIYATPAGYITTIMIIIALFGGWFAIEYKDRKKEKEQQTFDELVAQEVERLEQEAKNKN